jgi:hypothetical protein
MNSRFLTPLPPLLQKNWGSRFKTQQKQAVVDYTSSTWLSHPLKSTTDHKSAVKRAERAPNVTTKHTTFDLPLKARLYALILARSGMSYDQVPQSVNAVFNLPTPALLPPAKTALQTPVKTSALKENFVQQAAAENIPATVVDNVLKTYGKYFDQAEKGRIALEDFNSANQQERIKTNTLDKLQRDNTGKFNRINENLLLHKNPQQWLADQVVKYNKLQNYLKRQRERFIQTIDMNRLQVGKSLNQSQSAPVRSIKSITDLKKLLAEIKLPQNTSTPKQAEKQAQPKSTAKLYIDYKPDPWNSIEDQKKADLAFLDSLMFKLK